jgi:predicted AlkP superfamily phosphohydrolase/phosphomutase
LFKKKEPLREEQIYSDDSPEVENMTKVLLIGFDGASFDRIKSFAAKGELPNLVKFMENGCTGTMTTTIPPASAPAWASLATGMNPGKHGIFFFITRDGHVVLSDKIAGKTVWDIIGDSGRKVIILNMPMTYPPYSVNGIMISGMPCPYNSPSVYPPDLTTKLKKAVAGYQVDSSHKTPNYEGLDKEWFFKELCNVTEKRLEMALHLMTHYPWDFFVVVFTSLDRVQHVFWHDQTYLLQYYKILDSALNQLDQTNDTVTFVVSDHGFESCNKIFGINNWLENQGFLKRSRIGSRQKIFNLLFKLRRTLPKSVRWRIPVGFREKTRLHKIDASKTLAYSPFQSTIISPSLQVRKQIKEWLLKEKFVERVYEKEELYTGDHIEEAPDLFLALKDGYEPQAWAKDVIENVKKSGKTKTCKTGTHQGLSAHKALFMARGKSIKKKHVNPKIIDIAPTILKLMGVKIPSRIEGKVLDIIHS